ncbi:MAG: WYL domain-containing protein [Actinomycetota bacterium]
MAKSTINASLDRTARLLDLVPYLVVHQGISLKDLAKEFAISESQLIEDLNTLWMCGLPGYTPLELMDLSFDSGYVTIQNAETLQQPRSLSRDEALTLILGLGYLSDQTDLKENTLALERLIAKLSSSLGAALPSQVHAEGAISAAMRGSLDKAISDRSTVIISYHSMARDVVSDRFIHPLEFRIDNEVEYLNAYCEDSAGYRTFRLDRILDITPSHSSTQWNRGSAPTRNKKIQVEIAIASRLRDAYERFHLPLDKTNLEGDHLTQVESFSADWIIREVMSLGGQARLISPDFERDLVRQRSERALLAYGIAF